MLHRMDFVDERATPYPTVTDFFRTFDEEMHSLYLLSFLLTADHDKAEQCLVSAMGECADGVGAFMDWARGYQVRDPDDHARTGARGLLIADQSQESGCGGRKRPLFVHPFTGSL